jgi:PAS domain S-box-containing protein
LEQRLPAQPNNFSAHTQAIMSTGVQRASSQDELRLLQQLPLLSHTALGMIRAQAPLPSILEILCLEIEKQYSGLLCSILLLDADGKSLHHGAAPSLPAEYSKLVDGIPVGPCAGSCGTAAFRKQPVIVADVETDPLWKEIVHLARPHGLRACWSTPILSQDGAVLGTFAIYYREPRTPDEHHLQLIAHATQLAGIAIERDQFKAQLRAAETRYRTLVERLPAITYIAELGADGPWHYVSPQIESILGFSPASWLSNPTNWIGHIHPDDRPIVLEQETLFQKNHELFKAEYRMFSRDGRLLWFRDEGVKLEGPKGNILMQGVMYDITEHKRLEEQLRHSQKMEAVGQLAGGIAHDFNNLLMLIQVHNEQLQTSIAKDHPAHKDIQEISSAVTRAAALTGRLLAFSRKQVLQLKVLDLNTVVSDVARMLRRLLAENIDLKVVPGTQLGRVKVDPIQIEQVILNLALNARDAMAEGGKLTIETGNVDFNATRANSDHAAFSQDPSHPASQGACSEPASGNYVMLSVRDTGIGMDDQTRARIFEPFFTTKETGKGTGLGLATVYGVIRQSGGWISVNSHPGNGTTFKIYLPRVEAPLDVVKQKAPAKKARQGTETILLVEDQDGIREVVRQYLERQGYTVIEAADGYHALKMAADPNRPIHLLVSDLVMPNLGGWELADRLKHIRPDLRVLFMSGYPDGHDNAGQNGSHNGTSQGNGNSNHPDFRHSATILQKPFTLESLALSVRSAIDKSSS